MKQMNKKAMEVQTIFYIFMSIIMVVIIVFGLGQVMSVSEQLSDKERVEIQNKLKEKFETCDDPLSKGSIEYIKLENQKFNSICFLNRENLTSLQALSNFNELEIISNTDENVVLLNSEIIDEKISKTDIISTFKIDNNVISECTFPTKQTTTFEFKLIC